MKKLYILGQVLFAFLVLTNIAEGNTSGIFFCAVMCIVCTVMKYQEQVTKPVEVADKYKMEIIDVDGTAYPVL